MKQLPVSTWILSYQHASVNYTPNDKIELLELDSAYMVIMLLSIRMDRHFTRSGFDDI